MELKICFTKLVTLDVPVCTTDKDVHELIKEVAEDFLLIVSMTMLNGR